MTLRTSITQLNFPEVNSFDDSYWITDAGVSDYCSRAAVRNLSAYSGIVPAIRCGSNLTNVTLNAEAHVLFSVLPDVLFSGRFVTAETGHYGCVACAFL